MPTLAWDAESINSTLHEAPGKGGKSIPSVGTIDDRRTKS